MQLVIWYLKCLSLSVNLTNWLTITDPNVDRKTKKIVKNVWPHYDIWVIWPWRRRRCCGQSRWSSPAWSRSAPRSWPRTRSCSCPSSSRRRPPAGAAAAGRTASPPSCPTLKHLRLKVKFKRLSVPQPVFQRRPFSSRTGDEIRRRPGTSSNHKKVKQNLNKNILNFFSIEIFDKPRLNTTASTGI